MRNLTSLLTAVFITSIFIAAGPASPAGSDEYLTRPEKLREIAVTEDLRGLGRTTLLQYLDDPDWVVGRRTLLALARLQDEHTVPRILPFLEADLSDLREMCAFALGQIGDSTAAEPLAAALGDRSPAVRRAAAEALGKLGTAGAVAPLLTLFSDDDPVLIKTALLALARLGRDATADQTAGVIEGVVREIDHPDEDVRWSAAYCLERILPADGSPEDSSAEALTALAELLDDPRPLPRLFALRALGRADQKTGDDDAVKRVVPLLSDEDWRVEVEAARALGRIRGEGSVRALTQVLPADFHGETPAEWHLRAAALEALAETEDPDGIEAMKPYLTHPTPGMRWRAAAGLVALGSLESLPRLVDLLRDPDWTVRAKVARTLGETESDEVAGILRERLGEEPDVRVRAGLAAGLAAIAEPTTLPLLTELIWSSDPVLAATAAEGLGAFKDTSSVAPLGKLLRARQGEEWADTRWGAVEGLTAIGGREARAFLEEAVNDEHVMVAEAAAEGLRELAGRPLDANPTPAWVPDPEDYPPGFGEDSPWEETVIHTNKGDIEIELAGGSLEAPVTVANFAWLAEAGYFDSLSFHRVVPDFVIQGGCPRGDGWGGPGYRIRCEINRHHYATGAVGMALAGKDTGGSQFFITHSPQPRLDGRYTIFGHVVRGMEVVDAIREGDLILSVEMVGRMGSDR